MTCQPVRTEDRALRSESRVGRARTADFLGGTEGVSAVAPSLYYRFTNVQTPLLRVTAALIWLTVATTSAQQSPPGTPAPTCSVSGDVVDEAGQPVSNVTVVLFPADEQKWAAGRESKLVQWTAVDAGGAFAFSGAPPGEYRLAVSKEKVGDAGPDAAFIKALPRPFPIPMTAGDRAQVRLIVDAELKIVRAQRSGMQVVSSGLASSPTLPAGPGGRVSGPPGPPPGPRGPGAISGIVTGADGQPIAGAHIQRFTSPLRNGVPQFAPTGPAVTTDEHGEYHLTGIVAGDYVVAALAQSFDFSAPGASTVSHMPRPVAGSDGQKIGYVTTYYPGTDGARSRDEGDRRCHRSDGDQLHAAAPADDGRHRNDQWRVRAGVR